MGIGSDIRTLADQAKNEKIAKDLFEKIRHQRLSSSDDIRRRWIWELMQNAQDASLAQDKVKISIDFQVCGQAGLLVFKHYGRPFSKADIREECRLPVLDRATAKSACEVVNMPEHDGRASVTTSNMSNA